MKIGDRRCATVRGYNGGLLSPGAKRKDMWQNKKRFSKGIKGRCRARRRASQGKLSKKQKALDARAASKTNIKCFNQNSDAKNCVRVVLKRKLAKSLRGLLLVAQKLCKGGH